MTTGRGFGRGRVTSGSVTDQRARRTMEQLARGDDLGTGLELDPNSRRLRVKPAGRVPQMPSDASLADLCEGFNLLLTRLREAGLLE